MLNERLSFKTYYHGSTGRQTYFNTTVEVTGLYKNVKAWELK
jgi:hypothetical protein